MTSFSRQLGCHCRSEYLVGTICLFLLLGPGPVANADVLFDNGISSVSPGNVQLIEVPGVVTLYGSDRSGNLFTVDITTGIGSFVGGPISDPSKIGVTEIEYDNIGMTAFAQQPDGSFQGNFFDISTGVPTTGPISNGGAYNGLEYVGDTLYGTVIVGPGFPSELRILNPATGSSSLVGATGVGPISGLAHDDSAGITYGIAGGPGPAAFYTINLATGQATLVGSTGIQAGSLEFGPDGNLYAGGTGPNQGELYQIDPSTGASIFVGITGFGPVTGLTLFGVPTPCPWDCSAAPSGAVDVPDLLALLALWGSGPSDCDFDGSGVIAVPDLLKLLANWGPCP